MRRLITQSGFFCRGTHDLAKHSGGVIENNHRASAFFLLCPTSKELHAAAGYGGSVPMSLSYRPARPGPRNIGGLETNQRLGIRLEVARAGLAGQMVGIGHAQYLTGFRRREGF